MYKKISQYDKLRNNPPKLEIKKDAKEVIFYVVSCMCDNKYNLRLRKNDNGEFKMSGMGYSLSNFQFGLEHRRLNMRQGRIEPFEIEWEADNENWIDVINMINSGTVLIEKVISRCIKNGKKQ